jgi:hypothetical protein
VLSAAFELDPGAGQKIFHRARHENLARLCEGGDTGGNVHRQAANVGSSEVDFTGMDMPAQISRPREATALVMDKAQRTALAGPSNIARKPSPVVATDENVVLDELRAWDQCCDFSAAIDGDDLVLGPMEEQGGCLNHRDDLPSVGQHGLPEIVTDRAGPDGRALESRPLRNERLVTCAARREDRYPPATPVHAKSSVMLFTTSSMTSGDSCVRPRWPSTSPEPCTGRDASRRATHSGAFGLGSIEDRDCVVDLRLEVGERIHWHRVRQPRTPAIEVDQTREGTKTTQDPSELGNVPHHLDMVHP